MKALPTHQEEGAQVDAENEFVVKTDKSDMEIIEEHLHSEFIQEFDCEDLRQEDGEYTKTNQYWASQVYKMILREKNLFYKCLLS